MKNTLSVLFYPRNTTKHSDKLVVYVRLTYNRRRTDFSTGRKIELQKWNPDAQRGRGNSTEVKSLNKFLDTIRVQLYDIADRLRKEKKAATVQIIKDIFLGKDKDAHLLLDIFEDHNEKMKRQIGSGYTKGTLQRYKAAKKHLADYLEERDQKDISVAEVDHDFITGFEHFLKVRKKHDHNTAIKYIVNFKKIIRIAYANEWIERDPFFHWKGSWKTKDREYLTQEELDTLVEKEFSFPRLELVRDNFIFCCYTGLAYSDIQKLKTDDIVLGINGKKWIKTKRKKTKTLSSIPLLSPALDILEKYAENEYVLAGKGVLPVLSNQKSNAYLKEIADLCGISKHLTTHLARHTFATTVTLSNGVPIETVGKMLGHRSLKTTQIYAKILDHKIGFDMDALEAKTAKKKEQQKQDQL